MHSTEAQTALQGRHGATGAPDWPEIYRRLAVYLHTSFQFGIETEDVLQDVMERIIAAEPRRDRGRPLLPWCYRIARNRAVDVLRTQRLTAPYEDETWVDSSRFEGPESELLRRELESEVTRFLSELDPSDKEIAYLRFFEGLPYREISRIVSRNAATVRFRVHKIRRGLSERLEEQGYDEIA